MPDDSLIALRKAIESDDFDAIESAARANPKVLNPACGRPPITFAHSTTMAERLLTLGADLATVGNWWKPGFGGHEIDPNVGEFLVQRGAPLSIHAAAGLGLINRLAAMLDADPALVHAKGGDDCTPLHFARDCPTARLLLERGAQVDARDGDHDSTPAQWLIRDAPKVSRLLLDHGATPDIFLATALGDLELAGKLIAGNPACVACRIGKAPEFPPLGYQRKGGTIYQWTLAFNSFAHQIALSKGHPKVFDLLYEHSDTTTRFLVCCLLARREQAEAIAREHPGLVASLSNFDQQLLPIYCWETNLNFAAVDLMLDLGFPIALPETAHGYTALHNAAWAGAADLVDLLIRRGHPVDIVDPTYDATPLGFAMHDYFVEKRHPEGEFLRVFSLLLDAGSPWDALSFPTGDSGVDDLLRPRLARKAEGAALLGDVDSVFRLLGEKPTIEDLTKALSGAAKGGHAMLCRRLLENGALAGGIPGAERTPLFYALKSGSAEAVAILKESGATA